MTAAVTLRIAIESYWRAGTGRGASGRLDALCARDRDGLPYLPGRSVKGLLRDAVARAEQWGWYEATGDASPASEPRRDLARRLFGQVGFTRDARSGELDIGAPLRATESGCLAFTSARLPAGERAALARQPDLIEHLFATLNATAVERDSGTALDKSLRAEEVAVPLTLEATVSAPGGQAPDDWPRLLARALPLVRACGSGRSRGLGRCRLSIEESKT